MGERTLTIEAEGMWLVEDWESILVECLGAVGSQALTGRTILGDIERWTFALTHPNITLRGSLADSDRTDW